MAIKVVNKALLDEASRAQYSVEATILYNARHPNIVKVVEAFEDEEKIYMVSEYASGGDLQAYMCKRVYCSLDEERAKEVIFLIAQGLKYLHDRKIIHRDIKPENILMSDVTDSAEPIITDFGNGKILRDLDEYCTKLCGTKGYMAPELMHGQPYSLPVDIWGLGVLLYALISSTLPFPFPNEKLTENNVHQFVSMLDKNLEFQGPKWLLASDALKNLIRGMLEKDPRRRLSIDSVLNHPWI